MATKKDFRTKVRQMQQSLKEDDVYACSRDVVQNIISRIDTDPFEEFLFFYPMYEEVSLLTLAAQMLQIGKKVAFPKVTGEDMTFYRVTNLHGQFALGHFNIMEPVTEEPAQLQNTLCFVPGVAFDRNLNRLGHGKGYYDRFLMRYPEIKKVGICANRFFFPEVPTDPGDVTMDAVITETTVYSQKRHDFLMQ